MNQCERKKERNFFFRIKGCKVAYTEIPVCHSSVCFGTVQLAHKDCVSQSLNKILSISQHTLQFLVLLLMGEEI